MWQYRGQTRPPFAIEPGPGQESVWDYPRPPALVPDSRPVEVWAGTIRIAATTRAVRVLETAGPPTFYIQPDDVERAALVRASGSSFCEWKGRASYWSLRTPDGLVPDVAWSYEAPSVRFTAIAGYLAFYAQRVDECWVGPDPDHLERVMPNPGSFYGGWITSKVVGPFKGGPGTQGW